MKTNSLKQSALIALTLSAAVALAACAPKTAPPATGASSSAPGAADQGHAGVAGGGANPINNAEPKPQ